MAKLLYITNQNNYDLIYRLSNNNNLIIISLIDKSYFQNIEKNLKKIELYNFKQDYQKIINLNINNYEVVEELFNRKATVDDLEIYFDFIQKKIFNSKIRTYNILVSDPFLSGKTSISNISKQTFFYKVSFFLNQTKFCIKRYYFNSFKDHMLSEEINIDMFCKSISKMLLVREKKPKINLYIKNRYNFVDEKKIFSYLINSLSLKKNLNIEFVSKLSVNTDKIIKDIFTFIECEIKIQIKKNNFSFLVINSKSDEFRLPKNSVIISGDIIKDSIEDSMLNPLKEKYLLTMDNKNYINYLKNLFLSRLKDTRVSEFNFMIDSIPPSDAS